MGPEAGPAGTIRDRCPRRVCRRLADVGDLGSVPSHQDPDARPRTRGRAWRFGLPAAKKHITLGIGANYLISRGNKVPDPVALPNDPTVRERFETFGTQLSLNFGTKQGWSYISGGIGSSRRAIQSFPVTSTTTGGTTTTTQSDEPLTAKGSRSKTINYGGGARWFATSHIAFGFDLRWYAVNPSVATATVPVLPRQTLFVANAGISIH